MIKVFNGMLQSCSCNSSSWRFVLPQIFICMSQQIEVVFGDACSEKNEQRRLGLSWQISNIEVLLHVCESKKLHHFIFAITLSKQAVFRQFVAHIYLNKFPTKSIFHIFAKSKAENQLKCQQHGTPAQCVRTTVKLLVGRRQTSS